MSQLEIKNLNAGIAGQSILKDFSLTVPKGEVHALMGENGAGKSTLMKVLGGIYQPQEGRIIVEEVPTVMTSPLQAKSKGTYIPVSQIHRSPCSNREWQISKVQRRGLQPPVVWAPSPLPCGHW